MEKRRNRPEKYNRELVHKTVKAMERISEVRCNASMASCWHSDAGAKLIKHSMFLGSAHPLKAAEALG